MKPFEIETEVHMKNGGRKSCEKIKETMYLMFYKCSLLKKIRRIKINSQNDRISAMIIFRFFLP